jgi:hypothetical protein
VGTMTWTATSVTTGQLRYTWTAFSVVKNMARQFVVNDDFSGHFAGGVHQTDPLGAQTRRSTVLRSPLER